ncbi:hypothetical protein L227DRAFT_510766 [Lentinus tigrinus ALCF2SS1-6]|uniref:Carbohydrate-binding module family 13 protein n=1 Tax=Lentinus tigrinus ALCF2SS1-6 TaxID=1328759 RepID=A0A5C2RWQ7_9APHY|nr:hypothetical protein L227DRAFT_510766 [Lentinus tigrinus ALCF2SS1-6]
MFRSAPLISLTLASVALAQTYSATYLPETAPKTSEQGQSGTNQCGNGSDQNSMCQNVYINSLDDFCLFAPPQPGAGSVIGNTERIEVAWCVQGGHGTRVIPDGTIQGAHFVQTPDYVQVTGVGDFTKINIPQGDEGGELDPHGADGNGNPIGGLVFSNAFGKMAQMHEWTNFMAYNEFCIRACKDGPKAPALCQHIYDVMGCDWNMPGDYSAGSFDSCQGDSGEPMGVYGTSTFHQGQASTPAAHPAPSKSQCQKVNTVGNGQSISAPGVGSTTTATSSGVQASTTTASSASPASSTTASGSSASSGSSVSSSGVPSSTGSSRTLSTTSQSRSTAPPVSSAVSSVVIFASY